jgi:hypothetical protein
LDSKIDPKLLFGPDVKRMMVKFQEEANDEGLGLMGLIGRLRFDRFGKLIQDFSS